MTDRATSRRNARAWAGPTPLDMICVAAVAGMGAGLVEVALLAVAKFGLGRFTHLNPQVAWLSPMTYAMLFVLLAGLVLLLARRFPATTRLRIVAFLSFWLGGAGVLFTYQKLHKGAALIVAAGVATQVAILIIRHVRGSTRLARWSVGPLALVVVLLFSALNGRWALQEWRGVAPLSDAPADAPNVLLIIWDTVRAASLSVYGYDRETTPTLDRLAAESTVFDRAVSTAPWTLPSHASMFTGLYATELSTAWSKPLDDGPLTLAEVLTSGGWRTGGFVANTYNAGRETGIARGFLHYDDFEVFSVADVARSTALTRAIVDQQRWRGRFGIIERLHHRKHATDVDAEFLDWAARDTARPFFAFLNYFDAHDPYLPPAPFDTLFGPLLPDRDPALIQGRQYSDRELEAEIAAYDGAIAWLDHRLDLLLAELDRRGQLENTLVIVTSDHGEEFGEHDVFTHGNSLYDASLHVPLLVRMPGVTPAGLRVGDWVSNRDIAATVLELLGLDTETRMPGRSLSRFWDPFRAGEPPDTLVVAVTRAAGNPPSYPVSRGDMLGVLADPFKLIENGDGEFELYQLREDPGELVNRSGAAETKRVEDTLREWLSRRPASEPDGGGG